MEHATISDEIRKILVALSEEQQAFLVRATAFRFRTPSTLMRSTPQEVTRRQHQIVVEADQQREKGQVKGMAIAKRAVEGTTHNPNIVTTMLLITIASF